MKIKNKKVKNKNLQATPLLEFNGNLYDETAYLWAGSINDQEIDSIINNSSNIIHDPFTSYEKISEGHDFCKLFYENVIIDLSNKLNRINDCKYSNSFWKIAFGYWLYRHIASTYQKFTTLEQIDIENCDIKLLKHDEYLVPKNHYDYLYYFSNDIGVQQLVSVYYDLFSEKQFIRISPKNKIDKNDYLDFVKIPKPTKFTNPKVGLLGVFFTNNIFTKISNLTSNQVGMLELPDIELRSKAIDFELRKSIRKFDYDSLFEKYFYETLIFCIPMYFIEYFKDFNLIYLSDISTKKFSSIVSEAWISHIPTSIYLGICKEKNKKIICYEHGASVFSIFKNSMRFIDKDVADIFLTTGYEESNSKVKSGGFGTRDVPKVAYNRNNTKIKIITRTKFRYWQEFNESNANNKNFIYEMKNLYDLAQKLNSSFPNDLYVRLRNAGNLFWDSERTFNLKRWKIKSDSTNNFYDSINESKIVIIDHISTGFSELLLLNLPFILFFDVNNLLLNPKLKGTFNKLTKNKIICYDPQEIVDFLTKCECIENWWYSEEIQDSISELKELIVKDSENLISFFIEYCNKETGKYMNINDLKFSKYEKDENNIFKNKSKESLNFNYSDGNESENYIYHVLKDSKDVSTSSDELRKKIKDWVSEYHFSQERHNLLRNLVLKPEYKILELGSGCGAITRQLGESGASVVGVEGSYFRAKCTFERCRDLENVKVINENFQDLDLDEKFDIVTLIGVLEYSPRYFNSENPVIECLKIAKKYLKNNGILIIAIENQLGLKYFNGFSEDHIGIDYFGLESRYDGQSPVTFGKKQLSEIIKTSGFNHLEFIYPFPDYKLPNLLLTETAFKNDSFMTEYLLYNSKVRDYSKPEFEGYFDMNLTYPALCNNEIMMDLSNSFLVFASLSSGIIENFGISNAIAYYHNLTRKNEYNITTKFVLHQNDIYVVKEKLWNFKIKDINESTLIHINQNSKYICGLNLEFEIIKYSKIKNFTKVSKLFSKIFDFILNNGISQYDYNNLTESIIKPEFIDCIPSNVIQKGNELFLIDIEWEVAHPVNLGVLLLRVIESITLKLKDHEIINTKNLINSLKHVNINITDKHVEQHKELAQKIINQIYP